MMTLNWKYEIQRDGYTYPYCDSPFYEDAATDLCGSVGTKYYRKNNSGPGVHVHQCIELLYVVSGSMKLGLSGFNAAEHIISLKANDVILINCNCIHRTFDHCTVEYYAAFIPPNCLSLPLGIEIGKTYGHPYSDLDKTVLPLIEKLSYFSRSNDEKIIRSVLLTSLVSAVCAIIQPSMADGLFELRDSNMESDILTYVYKNFRDPELCVEAIARKFGYSSRYLSNLFRSKVGTGMKEYLDNLRINEAKSLLEHTDQSIESIAHSVGFESQRSFFRKFRETVGMTPGQWRTNGSSSVK